MLGNGMGSDLCLLGTHMRLVHSVTRLWGFSRLGELHQDKQLPRS